MNANTVRTLTWLAVLLFLVGSMISSPIGQVAVTALGAVLATVPMAFGSKAFKIAGLVLLLAVLSLIAVVYPEADAEMKRYTAHVHTK